MFNSIVESTTLCGVDTWPVTENIRNKIRTVELDFMRRSLQITGKVGIWKVMDISSSITEILTTAHFVVWPCK